MATHDYNIANDSGINVRSDLNAVLAAILSQNSSATEPTTMDGGMFWYDTTTGIFKQRNSTNTGWVDKWDVSKGMLATLNSPTFTGPVNLPTTTYVGGYVVATTQAPIFNGNSVFETLTAWSSVSLPASTTIGGVSATELSYLDGVTSAIQSQLNAKQATLVSGTNIKTINGIPLLGSGNIVIQADSLSTIFANSQEFTASGTFVVPAGVTRLLVYGSHAGAGGGGGGAGGGASYPGGDGGGGGASVFSLPRIVAVTAGQSIGVTIGAGGAGGAGSTTLAGVGGYGGGGGTTWFGSYSFLGAGSAGGGGNSSINTTTRGSSGGGGSSAGGIGGAGSTVATVSGMSATAGFGVTNSVATGGLGSTGGGGNGGTSDCNNGSNGVNTTVAAGGAGGAGGAGKVIVYW